MKAKTAYHHGNLKAALIAAALKEIAQEGVENLSLRGVARRAGVSAPAVYRHYADKEALLGAVAADASERLAAAMIEAVAAAPADDPLDQFRATGIALVQFAVAHPEHYRVLGIVEIDRRLPADMREKQEEWVLEQRRALLSAQKAGKLVNLPIEQILLCASAAMNGLAQAIISGRLGPVDAARATELANEVTLTLGVGFFPRAEEVHDTRTKSVIRPAKSKRR